MPTSSARYLRVSMIPPRRSVASRQRSGRDDATRSVQPRSRPGPRRSTPRRAARTSRLSRHVRHRTSTSSSRSTAASRSVPTATAPCRSSSATSARGCGTLGQRLRDPSRQLVAAHLAERHERQARDEQGRLGQGSRVGDLAAEGQRHRGGQVGMGDRADVPSGVIHREVDREIGRRPETDADRASRAPGPIVTTTMSSSVSSSLRRPLGVTATRSASSRTERLPSPAEIRPRDPRRRPAATIPAAAMLGSMHRW